VPEVLSRAQDALAAARAKRFGSFAAYHPNVERDALRKESLRATDEIVAALNERLPTAEAWATALTAAGITAGKPIPPPTGVSDQIRFEVQAPGAVGSTTTKLEAATLWAARVEPITRHYKTTWGAMKASTGAGFTVAQGVTIPDTDLDLIGLYVSRGIPDGAYALIEGERPADYWHVLPISVGLVLIGLLFLWALIRAIKRDLLPTAASS